MKTLIMAIMLVSAVQAGEIRPGQETVGVIEAVSAAGVTIDGRFYRVPGGTVLKQGTGKKQVKHQLRVGERVLFSVKRGKDGKASNTLEFIEPFNSVLDEVQ